MSASTSETVRRGARFFAATVLLSFCTGALGQGSSAPADSAGRFINVTGDVSIVARDGSRRAAQRNDSLREGDSIVTGGESLAQLRMRDGSLFSIRADTEAKLDEFRFAGRDDRDAGFAMSIVKGGFRTITGLIAQLNRSNYRISTPSATIGVRGTHFEAVYVPAPLPQLPAGTYKQVFEGITQLNAGGANLVVNRNQAAFAAIGNVQPVIIAPPPALFGRPTPVPRAAAGQNQDRAAEKGAPSAREGAATTRESLRRELGTPTVTDRAVAPIDSDAVRTAPTTLDRSTIFTPTTPSTTLERPTTTLSPTVPSTTTIDRSMTISPTIPSTTVPTTTTAPRITAPITTPTITPTPTTSPTTTKIQTQTPTIQQTPTRQLNQPISR